MGSFFKAMPSAGSVPLSDATTTGEAAAAGAAGCLVEFFETTVLRERVVRAMVEYDVT